jgi:Domain of unknown function (DUF4124)
VTAAPLKLLSLFAAAALLVAATHAVAAATPGSPQKPVAYRWVDAQGVVHYGDHIPPEYASQDRTVLNGEGITVGHVDAQKGPEQLAAEEHDHAEQLKRRQHDTFLISTYTSVRDIEALRDLRLDQLRGQRTAAEQYVELLRVRLASLQARAFTFRPYSERADARRMPDDLAENLVRTANEMRVQSSSLAAKSEAESALRTQFQADIERYRELHTIHSQ